MLECFVRFGSGCSEMSGAKDSKAGLSCEWPEETSLLSLAFLPPGSCKGTPESGDGPPEQPRPDVPPGSSAEKPCAYLTNQRGES